jgi:autotransporter-associated beta strand protein
MFRFFLALLLCVAGALAAPTINEVQSTNTSLPDAYGQSMDWVEIYNPTEDPIDLTDYYLSDSKSNKLKFRFPATTLAAGGYLVVWCGQAAEFPITSPYPSGQVRASTFNISSGGEPIVLTAPDGTTVVDEFPALAIGTNLAVGRSLGRGTGENAAVLYFFNAPTQGTANTTSGIEAIPLDPPSVSLQGGIYTSNQSVTINSPVADTTIRYTLDGSDPTATSPAYTSALALGPGGNNATTYSWIPTNQNAASGSPYYDEWQAPNGSVARIHVLRTRAFKTGSAPSPIVTKSYLIDPSGTNRHSLPVVSIASDPANLFSDQTGIYVYGNNTYTDPAMDGYWANYYQSGSEWERASHIECFEADGSLLLEGPVGIRINGNTTRNRPRKALRIYNRNPAGDTTWTTSGRLFPDRATESWDTFLLRTAGNDWNQSLFRDALVSAIAAPTRLDRQAARPAVVFLNGEYWGLHNLRERIDEGWFFHNYGVSEEQFALLEVTAGSPNFLNPDSAESWPFLDMGNPALLDDYKDILARAANNEFADEAGYETLSARIDLENYIDYNAVTIWSGNTDWPGNNVLLWRTTNATTSQETAPRLDGRWRYILKDNDFALGLNLPYVPGYSSNPAEMAFFDTLAYATSPVETTFANKEIATRLLRKALDNPHFKNQFVNRFADLLNTALSANATTAQLDAHIAAYSPGIAEHAARWPTPLNWTTEVERIRTYLQTRADAVRSHIATKFQTAPASLTVDVNPAEGSVTLNSLTLNATTPGVAFPWTGVYFNGIPVTLTAKANPGYRFVSWSRDIDDSALVTASDSASNYSSWFDGSTAGSGFGRWALYTSTADSNKAGTFLDNARGGWGFYANDDEWALMVRPLNSAMQVGQTFSARIRHGSVESGGLVSFALCNLDGRNLFYLHCVGEVFTYRINNVQTSIPVTSEPLDLEVTLLADSAFTARLTPVGGTSYTYNGTLVAESDRAVQSLVSYNYNAGSGSAADVFISSLEVSSSVANSDGFTHYSDNSSLSVSLTTDTAFEATFEREPATTLAIQTPAASIPGTAFSSLLVKAVNSIGDVDGNYNDATVTLTITGPDGFLQTLQSPTVSGIAAFPDVILPAAGQYSFSATSGNLTTASPLAYTPHATARFLPASTASWNTPANWDIQAVPNNDLATATFTAPENQAANRDATLEAAVTIASVVFENGATTFRNRINGTLGNPLTFSSANGTSSITVTGTGTGYANIEVAAGVVVQNDIILDIQNATAGNAEYGALRLQGLWSGPGGFLKRGSGLAGITGTGKTFSGNITIEQGVLTFSEPAISSSAAASYTVQPGGQLRLSSTGNPRNYLFSGPIHLAGNGRSGVPDNENLGVLGALRLETGTTGAYAFIEGAVVLTADADIHIPAENTLTLNRTLSGNQTLSKSGGGTLHLPVSTSGFGGGITVNRGTLHLGADLTSNNNTLALAAESTLTGNGTWGGLLRLPSGSILAPDLATGPLQTALAEIAIGSLVSLTTTDQTASGLYPLLTVADSPTELTHLSLAASPALHPETRLVLDGGTLFALVAATPREAWLLENSLALDSTEEADPDSDTFPNLVERALAMNPTSADPALPVSLLPDQGAFVFTYRVARGQTDLQVIPQYTTSLAGDWTDTASELHDNEHPAYQIRRVSVPAGTSGFLRLRIAQP